MGTNRNPQIGTYRVATIYLDRQSHQFYAITSVGWNGTSLMQGARIATGATYALVCGGIDRWLDGE